VISKEGKFKDNPPENSAAAENPLAKNDPFDQYRCHF